MLINFCSNHRDACKALIALLVCTPVVAITSLSAAEEHDSWSCKEGLALLQTHLQLQTVGSSSPSISSQTTNAARDVTHDVEPKVQAEPLLFAGVVTGRSYSQERDEVRKSWWQHPFLKNNTVKALFFVGEAAPEENASVALALADEEAEHGDIIHLPMIDSYKNLSLKTELLLQWFAKEQPAKFLAKVDDDSFPHLDLLVPELQRAAPSQFVYMGIPKKAKNVTEMMKQDFILGSRWAETKAYYNLPMSEEGQYYFPSFMRGSMYILSAGLVEEIAVKRWTTMQPIAATNEDLRVGLWVNIVNQSETVDYVPVQGTVHGCGMGDVVSQNLVEGQLECIWSTSGCCDEMNPEQIQSDSDPLDDRL